MPTLGLEPIAAAAPGLLLLSVILGLAGAWLLLWLERQAPRVVRCFVVGVCSAGTLSAIWLGAFLIGLTPASDAEQEAVGLIRVSSFGSRPAVQAAPLVADDALYLSKGAAERVLAAALR